MQLQVIWSTKESQVFLLEEKHGVHQPECGEHSTRGGQHILSTVMCDSDEIAVGEVVLIV